MTKKPEIRNRIINHTLEDPKTLTANPENFRLHPERQTSALRGSIKELGWLKSVLVNKTTGNIIDGHARVNEAIKHGALVPVDWVEITKEEERLALAILDPITEMATRDEDILKQLLENVFTDDDGILSLLEEMGKPNDLEQTGLKEDIDPDEVPNPPKNPVCKPGNLYILGKHRLLCGDSTRQDQLSILMDGKNADMVWTDPPYNVAYEGKTKDALKIKNDSMSNENFREFLNKVFACIFAHTSDGGAIYVAHADLEGENFRGSMREAGWLIKQCLIWNKNALVMGRNDYHWKHEPILYGWKPGASHNWYTDRKQTTVLEFNKPLRNGEHPTMKPVDLVEYMICNSSKTGDIVLDPFGGSGTTLIACEKNGRHARLMEIDPIYCDVIVKRWENATGRKSELVII